MKEYERKTPLAENIHSIAVAVCFTLSGYYGLYSSQKFVYSKIKAEFINRRSN